MSRQKAKGTRWETEVCRHMRDRLGDDRIERRALHGNRDMGDLHGIAAHGFTGIAECKAHATVTPALVGAWREQTVVERVNSGADFALLVVKNPRHATGEARAHVTLRDLARIAMPVMVCDGWEDEADRWWTVMTLDEALDLIGGKTWDSR